jgi:hypothetical protein
VNIVSQNDKMVIVRVLGIALAGCPATQKSDAMDAERKLAAAGCQMKLADSPEKFEHLKTLPFI